MQTLRILLLTMLVFFVSISQATVWRINNIPGIDADATTLAGAVAMASAGDTIYLEASPNHYGYDTLNKKLILIGPGYQLNDNDTTQARKQTAKLQHISIVPGAEGSSIQGIEFIGIPSGFYTGINIQANNTTIKRCYIFTESNAVSFINVGANITGVVIKQNFLYDTESLGVSGWQCIYIGDNSTVTIENNAIHRQALSNSSIATASLVGPCVIRNNILFNRLEVYNSTLTNNILISGSYSGFFNAENYNMCNSTQFNGPNSIQNADMNNIFVNNGGTVDNDYELACSGGQDGCGDGEFGHDMGMFGGPAPYKLSGIPDIPAIFQFGGTGSASDNVPLQINIKAKSHN